MCSADAIKAVEESSEGEGSNLGKLGGGDSTSMQK